MGILDGRIALVTGGGRGIGRGISEALGREGATVLINYRKDKEAAEETAKAIVAAGGKASIHQASTDVPDDCRRMMDEIHAQHGGLDIAIVNGGNASRGRSIVDTDEKELWNLVETHALGPHQLCRAFIPEMRKKGGGHVVFISSVATKGMAANGAPYNMGKAAMEALALTLAKEDMADLRAMDAASPFGRVCQPEDIAGAVLFLLSPWSGYVTGQRIEVDGGASGIRR